MNTMNDVDQLTATECDVSKYLTQKNKQPSQLCNSPNDMKYNFRLPTNLITSAREIAVIDIISPNRDCK